MNTGHHDSESASKAVLVTGCSTGLGFETAVYLAERGFDVFATVRNLNQEADLVEAARSRGTTLNVLQLDITNKESIEAAVETVVDRAGGIFGLVNNAGIGLRGCLEDLTDDEIRSVFEANVFGTIAVTRAVLPHLREAGRGRIITISSVGGRISTFGLSMYCATKFAQEGIGEALRLELAPFGVQSILIEPGIINTSRWNENRGNGAHALDPGSPYAGFFRRSEVLADRRVKLSRTQPVDVARAVERALTAPKPKMRYIVGRPAAAAIFLRRYLPEPLFDKFYFGTLIRRITTPEDEDPSNRPSPRALPRS